jgi:replicative DNA helicase
MSGPLINVEAEAELLGALMAGYGTIDSLSDILTANDFYEPTHSRIFEVVEGQAASGKSVSPIAVKGFLDGDPGLALLGGVSYLARLTGSVASMDCKQNAKMIADLASRRRMAEGLRSAAASCDDLALTPAEIIAEADAAISVRSGDLVNQATGAECFDELLLGYESKVHGVTTGCIPSLDALLGPMRAKQLVIGAGRPGMGKTALALSYALGAASRGHGVLYVSLEMSAVELAARMAADVCFDSGVVSPIPYSAIRDGELSPTQKNDLYKARHHVSTLPFAVIDAGSLTTGRLNMLVRRHARRMAAAGDRLELVIVDYLQLLSPDQRGRSTYEAVSEVSRALKAMAKDNGVAVFALAQLSRSVEQRPDKRPQLADLRDSGQIEQDADAVLFLRREEYYLRQDEPERSHKDRFAWEQAIADHQNKIEFILAKRRNGVTGNAMGEFHGYYQAVRG